MSDRHTDYPRTRNSLILQLQNQSDSDAWYQFIEIYRPIIYRMACKRGLQDADAQDLAQQVLLSVSQSIGKWEKNKDESIRFRHWLRKVARNAILKVLTRKAKDCAAGGTGINNALEAQPQDEEQAYRELEAEHKREVFFQATNILKNELSNEAWQIFQLAVVEGMSPESVAAQVNKSVVAVYAARARAIKRVRNIVRNLESDT